MRIHSNSSGSPRDTTGGVLLTTPHGDQERSCLVDLSFACSISLPLMGIRNVGRVPGVHQVVELTTPHGDQERPSTRRRATRPRSHYPSWGSGTRTDRRRCRRGAPPHYPSWGSGTHGDRGRAPRLRDLTTPHGDQERQPARRRPCTPPLTTPHGDQEPPGALVTHAGFSSSLPPHGDQERGVRRFSSVRTWTSLPLMGIRNNWLSAEASRIHDSLPLMGIRNVRDGVRRAGELVVSLPLMGIRNPSVTPVRDTVVGRSLPLMGIRNTHRSPPGVTRARSLPLMGIRNDPILAHAPPRADRLTTPHGDQERILVRGIVGLSHVLTTPHGDQERPPLPSTRNASVVSLPLMGIRNHHRHLGGTGRPADLTTPHGDQERLAVPRRRVGDPHSLPLMGIRNLGNLGTET